MFTHIYRQYDYYNATMLYIGAVYVNFENLHYHVNESDGSLEIGLVASPKPKFKFTVKLAVVLNLHNSNGSLGMITQTCLQ